MSNLTNNTSELQDILAAVQNLPEAGGSGISPTVELTPIDGGYRLSITDANGTKEADIMDGKDGNDGEDGVPCTHSWNGTVLSVTSASGTSSADLKGDKGDKGDTGEVDYSRLNDYLPLAGGTMTGELVFNGGDAAGGSKIVLETGKGQITNSGTQTLFGFTSSSGLSVGHSSYALNIRASSRPTINNSPVALKSEIPSVPTLTTETWTFTLEDGSTVEKAVYVG